MIEVEAPRDKRIKEIKVDGIHGKGLIVKIPEQAKEGTLVRLKGAGLPATGDLYVKFKYPPGMFANSAPSNNLFGSNLYTSNLYSSNLVSNSLLKGYSSIGRKPKRKVSSNKKTKRKVAKRTYDTPNRYDVTIEKVINPFQIMNKREIKITGVNGKKLSVEIPAVFMGSTRVKLEKQGLVGDGDLYLLLHYSE